MSAAVGSWLARCGPECPAKRFLCTEITKSSEELAAALSAKVGYIVVDSFEEIARLGFLAQQGGCDQRF